MPNYDIARCQDQEFATTEMQDPATQKTLAVEGRTTVIGYKIRREFSGKNTELQVARNYADAIKAIGGSVYERSRYYTYMKLVKDGKEVWAKLTVFGGANSYELTIVQRGGMTQSVTADAKLLAEGIGATGHVAVYGIYFDLDKADVKPESEPALAEIAKLLAGNPGLRVFIVGHTDNAGTVDYNMKLSQARADAVVRALVTKHAVNPQRMKAYGVGQLAPVASNKTDEGRAKNRRVDLVEQ
jgi:hypothetical protein